MKKDVMILTGAGQIGMAIAVEMDLSSRESIKNLIAKAQEYGDITMLVNAAGRPGTADEVANVAFQPFFK